MTIISRPAQPTSSPSANAPNIAASATGWSEPANEQARLLAERLAGREVHYGGSINATNLKVSGVQVFSAGDFLGAPGSESIVLADPGLGIYRKLVIAGRIAWPVPCSTAIPPTRAWYLELIRSGAPVESFRDDLVFGRALAERQAA